MDVAERVSLAELFDRHASLVIDADTYQTNPILKDAADRVIAAAGLKPRDVAREGVAIYKTYALITAWDNTEDGKPILRDGSRLRRVLPVDFGGDI